MKRIRIGSAPVGALLITLIALSVPALAQTGPVQGGDPGDLVRFTGDDNLFPMSDPGLAVSMDGVLFSCYARRIGTFISDLVVLRSENGGQSWDEWSVISPVGGSADSARLITAGGTNSERLFLSFVERGADETVWVYSTSTHNTSPSWHQVQIEVIPVTAGVYPRVLYPELAVRPDDSLDAVIGVAYWVETALLDFELHYSVSESAGLGFTAPHVLLDPPAPAGGSCDVEVELAFGADGDVYLATLSTADDATTWARLEFYTATANGVQLADWNPTPAVLLDDPSQDGYRRLAMASDPHGDEILLAYEETWDSHQTLLLGSSDGGLAWQPGVLADPTIDSHMELFWTPSGMMATAEINNFGYYVLRSDSGILGPYTAEPYLDSWLRSSPLQLVVDPTRSDQLAVLTCMGFMGGQEIGLWFNADWRNEPGYAVSRRDWYEDAYPDLYVAPPAVADLDGDGLAEIVIAEADGYLECISFDDYSRYNMYLAGPSSMPAVFDLDGDEVPEVVVGGSNGWLHVLDNELSGIGLSPYNLDVDGDVYVSVGAVTGLRPGEIVAAINSEVWLFNKTGTLHPGWPVAAPEGTVVGRASIGDVDGDGETEVVVPLDTGLVVLSASAQTEAFLLSVGAAPTAAAALVDLDEDGDLELLVPLSDGTVELIHHDGTTYSAYWPYDTGTGTPVIGVTVARVRNDESWTICFSLESGDVYALNLQGDHLPNYPVDVGVGDTASTEPIIARVSRPDVDRPQLLVGTENGWLHQWTAHAELPVDWPNYYDASEVRSPVVADMDGDGVQELILPAGGQVFAFDTGTPSLGDPQRWWPMTGYDLARSGCLDCWPTPATSVDEPADPHAPGADGRPRIMFAGAFPNPAPGRTTFRFSLPEAAPVDFAVFDLRGRRVRGFERRTFPAGEHALDWDGRDGQGAPAASGLYITRLVVSQGNLHRVFTRELTIRR